MNPSPEKDQNEKICNNEKCRTKSKNLSNIIFNDQETLLCEHCSQAVQNNWVCPYCKDIFIEGQTKADNSDWVGCDSEMCPRWTHIKCEAQKGDPQIKQKLKDQSFQYKCPSCRNKQVKILGKKQYRKSQKIGNSQDLKKIMIPKKIKKNFASINYYYIYSDSYKTIEKLLNSNQNNSLKLNPDELNEDFEKLNTITGRKLFNILPSLGKRRSKHFTMDDYQLIFFQFFKDQKQLKKIVFFEQLKNVEIIKLRKSRKSIIIQ